MPVSLLIRFRSFCRISFNKAIYELTQSTQKRRSLLTRFTALGCLTIGFAVVILVSTDSICLSHFSVIADEVICCSDHLARRRDGTFDVLGCPKGAVVKQATKLTLEKLPCWTTEWWACSRCSPIGVSERQRIVQRVVIRTPPRKLIRQRIHRQPPPDGRIQVPRPGIVQPRLYIQLVAREVFLRGG